MHKSKREKLFNLDLNFFKNICVKCMQYMDSDHNEHSNFFIQYLLCLLFTEQSSYIQELWLQLALSCTGSVTYWTSQGFFNPTTHCDENT